jgi:biopolymer transport protein ExbD
MTWSVRHAGSRETIDGLSAAEVCEGLGDRRWEPDDEVRTGHGEWTRIEQHPEFAAAAAEVEPAEPAVPDDETRLDMNPLIDVSLVLLIFFILTATYQSIRKVYDMPGATTAKVDAGARAAVAERVRELTIRVTLRPNSLRVEDQDVPRAELTARLNQFVRAAKKRQILLDAQGVEWGAVVAVMDAARAAGIEKTLIVSRGGR